MAGIFTVNQRHTASVSDRAVKNTPAGVPAKNENPLIAGTTATKHDTELNITPPAPVKEVPVLTGIERSSSKTEVMNVLKIDYHQAF